MKRKDEGVYQCDECGEEFFLNALAGDNTEECEDCEERLAFIGWRDDLGV